MQKPEPQALPTLGDISTRDGVRAAFRTLYNFLQNFLRSDQTFKERLVQEIAFLYGEFNYTPSAIGNGAQAIVTIPVAMAQLGYVVTASYSQSLQNLTVTYSVDSEGVVKAVLDNRTGGSVTLAAGRFRIYVQARTLSA